MLPDEQQLYSSCTSFAPQFCCTTTTAYIGASKWHSSARRLARTLPALSAATTPATCSGRQEQFGRIHRKSCLFHEAIVSSAVTQDAGLPRPARRAFSDGEATTLSAKKRPYMASTSRLGNEDGRWVPSQGTFGGSFRLRHVGKECSCLGKLARVGPAKRRQGPCPWGAVRTSAWGAPSAAAAWPAADPPPPAGPPRGMSWTRLHLS